LEFPAATPDAEDDLIPLRGLTNQDTPAGSHLHCNNLFYWRHHSIIASAYGMNGRPVQFQVNDTGPQQSPAEIRGGTRPDPPPSPPECRPQFSNSGRTMFFATSAHHSVTQLPAPARMCG
jgi:hypothetical protein